MILIKRLIFTLSLLIFSNFVFSQAITTLDKADMEFSSKNFYKATELYKKALKNSEKEEVKRIYFQLGECYRQVNNYGQARQWYSKAVDEGYSNPVINFHIGNLLLVSGDYRSAKNYFEKYLLTDAENTLAKSKLESCKFGISLETDKPFYEIKNCKELNSESSDYSLTFISDNKAVISSMRMESGGGRIDPRTMQGFSDFYESDFDAGRGSWSKPTPLKGEINTNVNEGTFAYNADSKTAYFMQCSSPSGKLDNCGIFISQYDAASNKWSKARLFDYSKENVNIGHPTITEDGKTMYFVADMPGGLGGTDIWMLKYDGFGWGNPVNLGTNVNTNGNEMFPFIFDNNTLYFSSDGQVGIGGLDIFSSENKNGQFQKAKNLKPPFNSSADDFAFIYKDKKKREGFFCSNRPGGVGDDDIYYFGLIPVIITLSDKVVDSETQKPLKDVLVYLQGDDGSLDSVLTDKNGYYKFTKLNANTVYKLYAQKDGYLGDSKFKAVGDEKFSIDLTLGETFSLIKITKEEIELKNIYYDYAKWNLREESKEELKKLLKILNENPVIKIMINSHTDVRGAATYNQELSEKRAQSVVEFLVANGISVSRLSFKGWGAERLLVKDAITEEDHQANRRTTFNILNVEEISSKFVVKTFEPVDFKNQIKNINNNASNNNEEVITPELINNTINAFFEGESTKSIEDILEMINKLFE
jgi:peptidoglycan-associated lipoprotein